MRASFVSGLQSQLNGRLLRTWPLRPIQRHIPHVEDKGDVLESRGTQNLRLFVGLKE
jgi:hypothetical protein